MQEYIKLSNGQSIPRLGMGTWYLGENRRREAEEIRAIRTGLDAGMRLIDTAEMYGEGKSEQLIGKAIQGYAREQLFLVSKVYPHNAGRKHIFRSVEKSLRNLGTEYLDLYLLHWRGSVPLAETVECMEELVSAGKIKSWGVSNFDTDDMEELMRVPGGNRCAVDQVLYHLGSRGVEYDLLSWLEEHQIPLMAYCPLAQAGELKYNLLNSPAVQKTAVKYGITAMQVLLAFVLHQRNVAAIPRTGQAEHMLANWEVRNIRLSEEDYRELDHAFPAPGRKVPLDIV